MDGWLIWSLQKDILVRSWHLLPLPRKVMDLSFAAQLNAMLWLKERGKNLEPDVYEFPKELDRQTARQKLETMGIDIDTLNAKQQEYATSYAEGT
ncbi:MAG: adenosylhomocysteinase [Candidatus Thorarchaeota archaeon]